MARHFSRGERGKYTEGKSLHVPLISSRVGLTEGFGTKVQNPVSNSGPVAGQGAWCVCACVCVRVCLEKMLHRGRQPRLKKALSFDDKFLAKIENMAQQCGSQCIQIRWVEKAVLQSRVRRNGIQSPKCFLVNARARKRQKGCPADQPFLVLDFLLFFLFFLKILCL